MKTARRWVLKIDSGRKRGYYVGAGYVATPEQCKAQHFTLREAFWAAEPSQSISYTKPKQPRLRMVHLYRTPRHCHALSGQTRLCKAVYCETVEGALSTIIEGNDRLRNAEAELTRIRRKLGIPDSDSITDEIEAHFQRARDRSEAFAISLENLRESEANHANLQTLLNIERAIVIERGIQIDTVREERDASRSLELLYRVSYAKSLGLPYSEYDTPTSAEPITATPLEIRAAIDRLENGA